MELAEDKTTTTNTSNYYNWTRYWLPSNISKPDMHANGFMRPRAGYFNGDLKTYDDLSNKNYLLLVGEPGIGKTKFCEQIRGGLQADELNQYWFRELKNITSDYSFDKKLIDKIKEKLENADDETNVYVFLDGLDEGLLQHNVIDTNFIEELKNLKEFNKRLKLRITCRTYDLPKDLEKGLKEFYDDGSSESNIYTLCPLTEDNVREAASKNNIDTDRFIEEIKSKELVPLAIRPITLTFLIGLFNKPEGLPNDIIYIYEVGIEDSIKEKHNELRKKAYTKEDTKKIFLVAARIAYLSILGNKPNLENDDFKGVNEEWNKNQIVVNDKIIEETFATQVFSKAGDQISFSHKTYAEFLAAYYLQHNNIGIDALKNLFFNDLGKVHPQLKEVAIWLSRYNKVFLELVVENDFEILFHKSNIQLDAKAKENIIDAYIKALGQGEVRNDWKHNFKVLNYKGLADKIISELNKTNHTDTITFLIQLARFCDDKIKLQNKILDVALNHPSSYAQIGAVNYLADYGDEIAKKQLAKKLKKEDFEDDKNNELKTALLHNFYEQLDFDELLKLVVDRNLNSVNYTGDYESFLSHKFIKLACENDINLSKTLTHFAIEIEDKKDVLSIIGDELMLIVASNLHTEEIRIAFVQFIGITIAYDQKDSEFRNIFISYLNSNSTNSLNNTKKQLVLEKLIPYLALEMKIEEDLITYYLCERFMIVNWNDFEWLIEKLKLEKNSILQNCWFGIIKKMCHREEYSIILNYFHLFNEIYNSTLHKEFINYYSIISKGTEEISRKAKQANKFAEESLKKFEEEKIDKEFQENQQWKKFNDWIKLEIEKIKSGKINHWICLVKKNIANFNVWERIEKKNQKEIIEVAKLYINSIENSCNCDKLIFGKECTQDFMIGSAFLLLIYHAKYHGEDYLKNQSKSFFDKWVERIVANKTAKHDKILKLFYNKVRERTIEYIKANFDYLVENKIKTAKAKEIFEYFLDKKNSLYHPLYLKDNEANSIFNYYQKLKTENRNAKRNLETFVSYVLDLEGQEINEVLYNIIINDNKLTNNLSDELIDDIINKLLRNEYLPILESIQFWTSQPIKDQDYDWFSGVFANTFFTIENNQDVLNKIIQKFMNDVDFEDYFIDQNVSKDKDEYEKFHYKVNKLNKKTCKKWLIHLDKRYPKKENSILGKSQIAELKKCLLGNIIQKTKDFEIINYYNKLKSKFKEKEDVNIINFEIIQAKKSLSQRCWQPLTPKVLLEIAKENKRSIENEKQLQKLVLEKLKEIQKKLKENKTFLNRFWNTKPKRVHKSENEISDEIKEMLKLELDNAITTNREVQVFTNEKSGLGSIDFQIDLTTNKQNELTLLVEAKGDFNSGVKKYMQTQAKENYLGCNPPNYLIYLVYYTDTGKFKNFEDCQDLLKKEAIKQSTNNHQIKSFVLDITFKQE